MPLNMGINITCYRDRHEESDKILKRCNCKQESDGTLYNSQGHCRYVRHYY